LPQLGPATGAPHTDRGTSVSLCAQQAASVMPPFSKSRFKTRITVGLQNVPVVVQMSRGVFAFVIRRVSKPDCRSRIAARRPVVTDISPQARGSVHVWRFFCPQNPGRIHRRRGSAANVQPTNGVLIHFGRGGLGVHMIRGVKFVSIPVFPWLMRTGRSPKLGVNTWQRSHSSCAALSMAVNGWCFT
jgi:hypothetical protein